MHKKLLLTLISTACFLALPPSHAQGPAPTPAASAAGKKALVTRILKVQQPGIENMSRAMAERPAQAVMEKAGAALATSVPADKREATAKDIEGYVKKYLDEAIPLVTARALRLVPTTVGTLLEDKFSEADLKQLATFLESPVYSKYQQLGGDMQKVLLEKLLADTRGLIEPKVMALDQAVGKRLGANAPAGNPATR